MFETKLEMGLGEAIQRHNTLHKMISSGIATIEQRKEYNLITEAMNNVKLDLGFVCNNDGIPDGIQIFAESAKTSCCRLTNTTSRKKTVSPRSKNKSKKEIAKKKQAKKQLRLRGSR